MDRLTYRFYDYHALCDECGWESYEKNAQGNAARHTDAHGHTVHVTVTGMVTYTVEGSSYHQQKVAS